MNDILTEVRSRRAEKSLAPQKNEVFKDARVSSQQWEKDEKDLLKANNSFYKIFWKAPFIRGMHPKTQEQIWIMACSILKKANADRKQVKDHLENYTLSAPIERHQTLAFWIASNYAKSKKEDVNQLDQNFGGFQPYETEKAGDYRLHTIKGKKLPTIAEILKKHDKQK